MKRKLNDEPTFPFYLTFNGIQIILKFGSESNSEKEIRVEVEETNSAISDANYPLDSLELPIKLRGKVCVLAFTWLVVVFLPLVVFVFSVKLAGIVSVFEYSSVSQPDFPLKHATKIVKFKL